MLPARANDGRAWLALRCAGDGTLAEVLTDDRGLTAGASRFADLIDDGSAQKGEKFLAALRDGGTVIGWHLNVIDGDSVRQLQFAGDGPLILAAPSAGGLSQLADDLTAGDVPVSDALRSALTEQQAGMTAALRRDNQLYEELSRLNNELINRERELARKSAALERMAAQKNRVLAIAAHDLRNPLTIIASYADLLRLEEAVSGEHLSYVEEIGRSARFMAELVEELLDSSMLESGHVEMDLQDLDLVAAAHHSAKVNRLRAERKEISIDLLVEADSVPIRADPVKLRQVMNNLVVNAIKFSRGGTTITLRVRKVIDRAVLEVEDQGIGIPRDQLIAIFEPFKTLGRSGTAGETSTGLGLAIVKQLVSLHGGTVEVTSEVGRGSLFRVEFPIRR